MVIFAKTQNFQGLEAPPSDPRNSPALIAEL